MSPAYLFEVTDDDKAIYDDSRMLDESWNELKRSGWRMKAELPTMGERQAAEKRMAEKSVELHRVEESSWELPQARGPAANEGDLASWKIIGR